MLDAGVVRDRDDNGRASSLAFAFTTAERPQEAQRLILSVRRYFPSMSIYVADRSVNVAPMMRFYEQMEVTLVRMPFDAGDSASRNRLVERVVEDHFVLCGDDFVIGPQANFTGALAILDKHPDIGVVGGKVYGYDGRVECVRHREMFLYLDKVNKTLTSVPIYELAPVASQIGSTRFYACDTALNFALFRRSMFKDSAIRWDERLKSNGDLEDFYLNVKLNSRVRVVYLPTMVSYQYLPMDLFNVRSQLHQRQDKWSSFFDKWRINQHLEIGLGVRTINDLRTVITSLEANQRFFFNESLSLHRSAETEAILVRPDGSLSMAGSLDDERDLAGSPNRRYGLVPSGTVVDCDGAKEICLFRYNPIFRKDTDFVVWCQVIKGMDAPSPFGVWIIHVRWTSDDGRVRMWEGARLHLDLSQHDYWVPLTLEVPLFPRQCAFMRFEVIAGEGDRQQMIATGFLFKSVSTSARAEQEEPSGAPDVLALAPWTAGGTEDSPPPRFLDAGAYEPSERSLVLAPCEGKPMLTLISTDQLKDWDIVLLFGWDGLGFPLMTIPLGAAHARSMDRKPFLSAALPTRSLTDLRIVVFSKQLGYRDALLASGTDALAAAVN